MITQLLGGEPMIGTQTNQIPDSIALNHYPSSLSIMKEVEAKQSGN